MYCIGRTQKLIVRVIRPAASLDLTIQARKAQHSRRLAPTELAAQVFAAIATKRFWVLPHKGFEAALPLRVQSILEESNPQFQMSDVKEDVHASR